MSKSELWSLIELLFVYGVVLALLGWQLWDVTQAQKKSRRKTEEPPAKDVPPES